MPITFHTRPARRPRKIYKQLSRPTGTLPTSGLRTSTLKPKSSSRTSNQMLSTHGTSLVFVSSSSSRASSTPPARESSSLSSRNRSGANTRLLQAHTVRPQARKLARRSMAISSIRRRRAQRHLLPRRRRAYRRSWMTLRTMYSLRELFMGRLSPCLP